MAVSEKIISGNDQPSGGKGVVSMGGARGLGASGTLITEIANFPMLPSPPYTAAQLDMSKANLDGKYEGRFDDTNYYHGSGSYGGPS